MKRENKEFYQTPGNEYVSFRSENGLLTVDYKSVKSDTLNLSAGNGKVGKVACFNLPVHYSCRHDCECYSKGLCYACSGCYMFPENQATYSENLAFWLSHTKYEFIDEMFNQICQLKNVKFFRWFTCGDFMSGMVECAVEIARLFPGISFWVYTKKYALVNAYCDRYGRDSIPENLKIIFSHWMNQDGSYLPMDNPNNFPTSEFIPYGREDLAQSVTHVCPCSDPDVLTTCDKCDHACYTLNYGESMALLEHSTTATKARDKEVKAAHEELKKAKKAKKAA